MSLHLLLAFYIQHILQQNLIINQNLYFIQLLLNV